MSRFGSNAYDLSYFPICFYLFVCFCISLALLLPQALLLVGLEGVLEIEPGFAVCKASSLLAVLDLWSLLITCQENSPPPIILKEWDNHLEITMW